MDLLIREFLDSFESARPRLSAMSLRDLRTAHRSIRQIAERGVPLDLLEDLLLDLERCLPGAGDPDRALVYLARMVDAVRSPLSLLTFLGRKRNSLAALLRLFGNSQYFGDIIVQTPENFDYLWEAGDSPVDGDELVDELTYEFESVGWDEERVMNLLRARKRREILRIGYLDVALGAPVDRIARSISHLADGLIRSALAAAMKRRTEKHGAPIVEATQPDAGPTVARIVVFALGKLGGAELNYSSDVDLIAMYDDDGITDGAKPISNADFFAGVVQDLVKYLSKATARGTAYRVDLRLRPYGKDGPIVLSKAATLAYYDRAGVTWERQALIKARPIAGDSVLGAETLEALVPFIYRRYLSFVEINEIKSMKRKIERRANDPNGKSLDLKVGFGGIRDTEFVVQFLQLLHGFRYADLREANTLVALRRLARHGCVNQDEYAAMETAYRFLRKVEHRLQFLFDRQTHSLPDDPIELDRLGRRLGYPHDAASTSGERFASDLQIVTARNRSTLNRLLHGPFDADGGAGESTPETDLALDDEPNDETVATTLGVYGFKSVDGAYRNLRRLAVEEIPFLSSVRCRHFLAGLAPKLLTAIGATPDPDETLNNLVDVSSSIGAKGVLWESCSVNPEILKLFVKLCSRSRLLTELLIRNPGMIDELLDSLMMSRPPSDAELIDELESLLRGAVDVNPILHSFKSRRLLDIGVADLLGKRSVVETTGRLSGVADAALVNVVERHRRELNEKVGEPLDDAGRRIRFGLFALGKHGGREIGYHSDLDLLFLYEREGTTAGGTSASKISGQEYFVELVRRMTATLSKVGPLGKLYAVDFRLRPTGKSGNLVINIDQFRRYFEDGSGQVWERQALTRCRFIAGDADFGESATAAVREQCVRVPPETSLVDEVANMRTKLNESRSHNDFKRGEGGIVDVEFAVQLTQLRHGGRHPSILNPNIWSAIEAIEAAGLWSAERAKRFADGYRFLRTVECRLGVINGHSNTTWPDDADEVRRLAIRLDYPPENAAPSLMAQIDRTQRAIKSEFEAIVARERRDEIADVKADQPELKAE